MTIATVKLVDKKLRLVEVVGARPPEWRRPTLKYEPYGLDPPRDVAFCLKPGSRSSTFIVDNSALGDAFLAKVAKAPLRASPYGLGWRVQE
jgi:hypothetical protein